MNIYTSGVTEKQFLLPSEFQLEVQTGEQVTCRVLQRRREFPQTGVRTASQSAEEEGRAPHVRVGVGGGVAWESLSGPGVAGLSAWVSV